ncbi:LLM class flavin-dependent oxidoreductase [Actinomadura chibensis]|uniref:LLM class flavin-dependent oxidoreductase n=1 Tax=Actinomadura chibensis TaxID=392828 RepID=A0A5D0NPW5_9ACTN|nr:LLM class flavin-dependent oxidoreductase [Actinomadura chibensis]TYB46349.1 LLM class flavin-dependent oxidoreductase [Actinomadura chibensis]
MTATPAPRLGVVLGSAQPPGEIVAAARAAERGGFDEIWVGEDYFFTGAIAAAGAVLAHTSLPVGIGIVPTASRHPALLAMELATLAGIYPGRLTAGVGVGVPDWLDQMGVRPAKPLTSIKDVVAALRTLFAGETLDLKDASFVAEGIRLEHPPARPPAVFAGVGGPKALSTAGRIADGAVLSVLAGDDYVRWAAERVATGAPAPDFGLVTYAFVSMDDDPAAARRRLRGLFGIYLLSGPRNPMTEAHGIAAEAERLAALPFEDAVARIPDAWLDELAVVGTPADCAARIEALAAAGSTSIALCPVPDEDGGTAQLEYLADELLPRVRSGAAASNGRPS